MNKVILFALSFLITTSILVAQNENNDPKIYKITFLTIDEYQLKAMVPICEAVFESKAIHQAGDGIVLKFKTNKDVTKEMLAKQFLKQNYTYSFTLNTITDEK